MMSAVHAGAGIALGRLPIIHEDLARGLLVALMPHRRLRGSWRYVASIRPSRVVDEPLNRLIEFIVEDARRLGLLSCVSA